MKELINTYKKMQEIYGDKDLDSVFGGGQEQSPDICLVFVNPTARNIASSKEWKGIKYQWLGTKQIWNFLTKCGIFDSDLNEEIQSKKAKDWDYDFADKVYQEVKNKNIYITNLAKCTQKDARYLPDSVFHSYKKEFLKELELINPKKIIMFGNQVSSILLNQPISVGTCRKKKFQLNTGKKTFESYAVYYPVGNGFFNAEKAIQDIQSIMNEEIAD